MKRPQIDIIKYALIATAIFTLILILVYVYRFHHGLSYNHNDFADFGSYLGSITGLLAFIGVLYTIKDSQINRQIDNERSTFYNLLGLYQHQVDTKLRKQELKHSKHTHMKRVHYSMLM